MRESIKKLKTINPIEDAMRPNNFHIRLTVPPELERILVHKRINLSFYERDMAGTLDDAKIDAERILAKFLEAVQEEDIQWRPWENKIVCSIFASCIAYGIEQDNVIQ